MIQITPHIKIYLCREPIDLRKGIDGLSAVCRRVLEKDPFCGSIFIFRNRRRTTLKMLLYDGQGYWLFVKRLSKGRFQWWPRHDSEASQMLAAHQLHVLLSAGNPAGTQTPADWRPVCPKS